MYCSSSFLSPNFTKHRRTARFSLSKSMGIFVVSGFIAIPNPRFNPSVSKISFDTDSLLLHKLWHFKLFGFRGRFVGSFVLIRCTAFFVTENLASAMMPNFWWHISYAFCCVLFLCCDCDCGCISRSLFLCSLLLLRIFLNLFVLVPAWVFRPVSICPSCFFSDVLLVVFYMFHMD